MKAVLSNAPGGPETLELSEVETPEPKKGEVLVAIKAAGVNLFDTLIIKDMYQFKPPRPFAPGGEFSGVIEALGEGVDGYSVGDRVLGMASHGCYASHIAVSAKQIVGFPEAMPFDEAAGFMTIYGTSYHGLKDRGQVQPGELVLITGASGGVGSAAIELAKGMGAKVIAAVSSEEKAKFCKGLGADETLVYPSGSMDRDAQKTLSGEIKAKARAMGHSDGVDVVYDSVGGDYAEPIFRSMAWKGRFLVVGFPGGIPKLPLNLTLLKGASAVGVFWGAFTMREPEAHQLNTREMFEMYANGKIRPRVTKSYPLAEAEQALGDVEARRVTGKIVLVN